MTTQPPPSTNILDLCASDLMKTDLVTLTPGTPLREALALFEEYRISGAPVIDEASRGVVGVFSASDIIRGDCVREERERAGWYREASLLFSPEADEESDPLDGWDPEADLEQDQVGDLMTPRVLAVDPGASLATICSLLTDEEVHRLLVTEEGKLLGIVTTTDVVRAIAKAC